MTGVRGEAETVVGGVDGRENAEESMVVVGGKARETDWDLWVGEWVGEWVPRAVGEQAGP